MQPLPQGRVLIDRRGRRVQPMPARHLRERCFVGYFLFVRGLRGWRLLSRGCARVRCLLPPWVVPRQRCRRRLLELPSWNILNGNGRDVGGNVRCLHSGHSFGGGSDVVCEL